MYNSYVIIHQNLSESITKKKEEKKKSITVEQLRKKKMSNFLEREFAELCDKQTK